MKSFRDKKYKIYLSENNLTPKRSKDKMIILKDKLKHNKFESFLKYKHNNNKKKMIIKKVKALKMILGQIINI